MLSVKCEKFVKLEVLSVLFRYGSCIVYKRASFFFFLLNCKRNIGYKISRAGLLINELS